MRSLPGLQHDMVFASQTRALGYRQEAAQAQLLSSSVYDFCLPGPLLSDLYELLATLTSGLLMACVTEKSPGPRAAFFHSAQDESLTLPSQDSIRPFAAML